MRYKRAVFFDKLQFSGEARGKRVGGFSREKSPPHPQNPKANYMQVKTVYLSTPCRTCIVPLLSCCKCI